MSTTVSTDDTRIHWGKGWNLLDWDNDVIYYYKEEMEVTGKPGNHTFTRTIYRSDNPNGTFTAIGTRNPNNGAIELNNNAADVEKSKLNRLTHLLRGNSSQLDTKMHDAGITLNNVEEQRLTNIGANGNDAKAGEEVDVWEGWEAKLEDIEITIEGRRFRKSYGDYYYPSDLSSNKQDRIRFTQKYSEGTKVEVGLSAGTKAFQRKVSKINGSVTLPIVTGIGDQNAVDWAGKELSPLQALGAAGAISLFEEVRRTKDIAGGFARMGNTIREASSALIGQSEVGSDMAKAINVYLAQQAVGAQGLLSRTTGAIVNPNLEMLFGGPKLRNFNFTFKLSPRDADEATQVRKILRFFKQGMSVKTSSSNVFLKAPNIFDIQYQTFNTEGQEINHPSINFIKTCALTSCDVQYTPDGTYMTYEDPYRTLTSYQLTLSFGELDPIFDNDYSDLDNDQDKSIGY